MAGDRAWRIHAWRDEDLERRMTIEGFVAVGGREIGDLTNVEDAEVIGRALRRSMPDRTDAAIRLFMGYWRRFLWEMQEGDVVVLPTQRGELAIGLAAGPYQYIASEEEHARHRRPVEWIATGIPRADVGKDLRRTITGRHTIQEFKQPGAARRLHRLANTGVDPT